MTTFNRSFFGGPVANTGAGLPKSWQRITCPKCDTPAYAKCRRWTSERTTSPTGQDGTGRWTYLKQPHRERVKAAAAMKQSENGSKNA